MSKHITINIDGMHCRSCELLLEGGLSSLPGVTNVEVSHKKGTGIISYGHIPPKQEEIERVVRESGYRLGAASKRPFFSRRFGDYGEFGIALSVVAALYLILKSLGVLDISLSASATPGLLTVILIGLVAGVSTCMALVGGLVLGISARHAERHPEASAMQKFRPHLFFNIGRLVSYALLGGVIGLIGSALQFSSVVLGILVALVGVVMLVLGLKLTELFPRMTGAAFTLPSSIGRMLGIHRETKEYSHTGALVTGALTFFLPCGFTQAMQLYAVSTGSFTQGAAIMFLFALGTMPGLLGIGGITSSLTGALARYFFKFASAVVIALALFNIGNGFALAGYPLFANDAPAGGQSVNVDASGVQIIRMEQYAGGYRPNKFTVKKGVPVRWIINSTYPYTCAAFITVPQMKISKSLEKGENVIEFTPTQAGKMNFSCSMGMYRGVFTVVE